MRDSGGERPRPTFLNSLAYPRAWHAMYAHSSSLLARLLGYGPVEHSCPALVWLIRDAFNPHASSSSRGHKHQWKKPINVSRKSNRGALKYPGGTFDFRGQNPTFFVNRQTSFVNTFLKQPFMQGKLSSSHLSWHLHQGSSDWPHRYDAR